MPPFDAGADSAGWNAPSRPGQGPAGTGWRGVATRPTEPCAAVAGQESDKRRMGTVQAGPAPSGTSQPAGALSDGAPPITPDVGGVAGAGV